MEMFCVNVSMLNISTRFNQLNKGWRRWYKTGAYLLLTDDRERWFFFSPPNLVFPNSSILNPPGLWVASRLTSYYLNTTSASSQVVFPSAAAWQKFMWCYSRHDWRPDGGIKPENWLGSFIRFSWSDTPAHRQLQKIDKRRQTWWNSHPSVLWPPPPPPHAAHTPDRSNTTYHPQEPLRMSLTPPPLPLYSSHRLQKLSVLSVQRLGSKGKSPALGGERMWYNSGWACAETQPSPRRLGGGTFPSLLRSDLSRSDLVCTSGSSPPTAETWIKQRNRRRYYKDGSMDG